MLYSCYPEDGSDPGFTEDTEYCHGMIYRYKGFRHESWRNVARKALADADVMGSREGVWHHFTYFPKEKCAIGLRKTEDGGPPVISTPDVYVSNVCFEPDGITLKDACQMCTCENSEACPNFSSRREPLGDVRFDIMQKLKDSDVVDLKSGEDPPRERRLEVSGSRFSYGAHFMPKMTHKTNHDVNCNLFNKMWMNNPERIYSYINRVDEEDDPNQSEFVGITLPHHGPLRVTSDDSGSTYYDSSDDESSIVGDDINPHDHHRFLRRMMINGKK